MDYGFRLPSALDNRPLNFDEFYDIVNQAIFVSATPGRFEKEHAAQNAEQIIRPTGLLDPDNRRAVRRADRRSVSENQDDGWSGERVLVTTLTKKMAEDLTDYLNGCGYKGQIYAP